MNGFQVVALHPTRIGQAKIVYNARNGRFHVVLGEEDLGSYANPQHAVDDLAGGYTFSHSSGVDTSELGIPEDVREWEQVSPSIR